MNFHSFSPDESLSFLSSSLSFFQLSLDLAARTWWIKILKKSFQTTYKPTWKLDNQNIIEISKADKNHMLWFKFL